MFETEQSIVSQIAQYIKSADAENATCNLRRIYLSVAKEDIMEALTFCKNMLGFTHLGTITGLDTGEGYEFIYHVINKQGVILSLKYQIEGRDGVVIPSVLPIYEGATFYELELQGLFGITVDGLPSDRQYPLPDNWPKGEYPMRKNWTKLSDKASE